MNQKGIPIPPEKETHRHCKGNRASRTNTYQVEPCTLQVAPRGVQGVDQKHRTRHKNRLLAKGAKPDQETYRNTLPK